MTQWYDVDTFTWRIRCTPHNNDTAWYENTNTNTNTNKSTQSEMGPL